jgi:hypothetical protein
MNTAELYVEPILIGALTVALLSLPFAPELWGMVRSDRFKSFDGVAFGALLVGVIYFVGILADRLMDTCLDALDRHNRVRFALSRLNAPARFNLYEAKDREWIFADAGRDDFFPEDIYRWRVFTHAPRIADSLDYIRTRIRLLRALAFLLPGLVFAGALGALRLTLVSKCVGPDGTVSPPGRVRCDQTDWIVALPVGELPFPVFLAPVVYAVAIAVAAGLRTLGGRQWRKKEVPFLGGVWAPPNTRHRDRMRAYAEHRGWPVAELSFKRLWLDIALQPVALAAILLLVGSFPFFWVLTENSVPRSVVAITAGLLLTVSAGWAWWRITVTFMAYLDGSGRFLSRDASKTNPGPR